LKQLNVVNYVPTTDLCIVRARRLLISKTCRTTHMHPAHGGASWALNYIRNAFGIAGSERKKNRLYISRADARARKIANESEVTACLRRSGFTEIIAADLSFDEQVDLFRHASHVVSIHGAGLTNIVFCPPGAHILEFFHPLYGSWAYGVLSAALSLDYRPFIGCDALSDDQLYNDPDQPDFAAFGLAGRDAALNRDIRVDIAQIEEWLMDVT
jgi:capsular polysaccharide biosynthesis protein